MDHWTRMDLADARIREMHREADANRLIAAARAGHSDSRARTSLGRLLRHVGIRGGRPVPTATLAALKGAE
jgi:hypothetical protein